MQAYREGRCSGVSELYELRKLHERAPDTAASLLEGTGRLLRRDIVALRSRHPASRMPQPSTAMPGAIAHTHQPRGGSVNATRTERLSGEALKESRSAPSILPLIQLTGLLDDVRIRVVLDRVPEDRSHVFVLEQDGVEREVSLAQIVGLRLGRTC
jgi:ParB family chromosome partitioning protein